MSTHRKNDQTPTFLKEKTWLLASEHQRGLEHSLILFRLWIAFVFHKSKAELLHKAQVLHCDCSDAAIYSHLRIFPPGTKLWTNHTVLWGLLHRCCEKEKEKTHPANSAAGEFVLERHECFIVPLVLNCVTASGVCFIERKAGMCQFLQQYVPNVSYVFRKVRKKKWRKKFVLQSSL